MKVLGILGSPRKKGNTDLLLEEALKGAESEGAEVEKIVISDLKIAPCDESYRCLSDGKCQIDDDMQKVYPKLLEADGVILASPIFFYGVTSQAKALVDRCQALWVRKYLLKQVPSSPRKRKGVFLSVGATRGQRLFDGAVLTVRYFFDVLDIEYSGNLLINGVEEKGEIKEHPTALNEAFDIGRRLVHG